jgi:hypothetical protein
VSGHARLPGKYPSASLFDRSTNVHRLMPVSLSSVTCNVATIAETVAGNEQAGGARGDGVMEPDQIFELIVKADEKLKYATAAKGDIRAKQAADLLSDALREAEAIGNESLVQQARLRMADLEAIVGGPG